MYIVTNLQTDKTSSHRSLVAAKKAAESIFQCSLAESHKEILQSLRSIDTVIVTPMLGFMNTEKHCIRIEKTN